MPRIVSLLPSSTEIVCALGFEKDLVGRSHECDYPTSVKNLPICTAPKFNPEGSSYEINARVKALLQDGLSVYRVDAELMKKLRPDIIVTQTQCEVCAVSLSEVEAAVSEWLGTKPQIVALAPNSLEDIWKDIDRTAQALHATAKGKGLVSSLKASFSSIQEQTRSLIHRTVACIEWIDPLMAAGNWVPTLVECAGGVNLFGTAGQHSPWMQWESLVESDPDIIILMPCGFDIPRTIEEAKRLIEKPAWNELKAVRERQVFVVDGNQYFNRPGPRIADSLEILAELFHPDKFDFGHRETGWVPFSTL